MAYDEGLARLMRDDLGPLDGLTEQAMFGGLCFMQHGNMICGIHKGGGLYRVGKAGRDAALSLPNVQPMRMGGRTMGGYVELPSDAMPDDATRLALLRMARSFTATLPPK